jgi:hypothetical protein
MNTTKADILAYLRGIYGPGLVDSESFHLSSEIALYWFASDYHSGQASDLYSILSTSPYRPSPLTSSIEDEGDELAFDMYDDLRAVFNVNPR